MFQSLRKVFQKSDPITSKQEDRATPKQEGQAISKQEWRQTGLSKTVVLPEAAKSLIKEMILANSSQLLRDSSIRRVVVEERLARFLAANSEINVFKGKIEHSIPNTVEWNLDGLKHLAGFSRGDQILRVLLSIDDVAQRLQSLKVLIVGPRIEDELLALVGWGFGPDNVHGLDLISYSPFVDVGDMHDMPYETGTFDIAILSNVVSYSTDQSKAISELLRVSASNSILAVSEACDRRSKDVAQSHFRALFGGDSTSNAIDLTTKEILALFGSAAGHVIFDHPIPDGVEIGSNIVIFRKAG
ncbi:MAG: class SAM-dependent methyltransferase [Bryobacterales bacterium]|nr:class SAM-dependent methyltransferase [Bryobacterales bacterium]